MLDIDIKKYYKVLYIDDISNSMIVFYYDPCKDKIDSRAVDDNELDLLREYIAAGVFLKRVNYPIDFSKFDDISKIIDYAKSWGYKKDYMK